jgi:ferredoxin
MCQFCTEHGEGKKWFENASLYSQETFRRLHTREGFVNYLRDFRRGMEETIPRLGRWRARLPRVYDLIAAPLVTRHMKKSHFGQVVTIGDVETVLRGADSVVRLPCVCRRVTLGVERRYCFGLGFHIQYALREVPDFSDFDEVPVSEAMALMRGLSEEGQVQSVWTFNTPFIGAICNCDRDCMAYRFEKTLAVGRIMWRGERVAVSDPTLCDGCGRCLEQCIFGALSIDGKDEKCAVNPRECYGCGLCRDACEMDAIELQPRPAGVAF